MATSVFSTSDILTVCRLLEKKAVNQYLDSSNGTRLNKFKSCCNHMGFQKKMKVIMTMNRDKNKNAVAA